MQTSQKSKLPPRPMKIKQIPPKKSAIRCILPPMLAPLLLSLPSVCAYLLVCRGSGAIRNTSFVSWTFFNNLFDIELTLWYNTHLLARRRRFCGEPHVFVSADTRQKAISVKTDKVLNICICVIWICLGFSA